MWTSIATFSYDKSVAGLWLRVVELLPTNQLIKIEASGTWQCFGSGVPACGPQGYLDVNISSDQLALPKSPPGALIGKLGGSDSGRDDGSVFPIGEFCVIAALDKRVPFFVSANGAWRLGTLTYSKLKIQISSTNP